MIHIRAEIAKRAGQIIPKRNLRLPFTTRGREIAWFLYLMFESLWVTFVRSDQDIQTVLDAARSIDGFSCPELTGMDREKAFRQIARFLYRAIGATVTRPRSGVTTRPRNVVRGVLGILHRSDLELKVDFYRDLLKRITVHGH